MVDERSRLVLGVVAGMEHDPVAGMEQAPAKAELERDPEVALDKMPTVRLLDLGAVSPTYKYTPCASNKVLYSNCSSVPVKADDGALKEVSVVRKPPGVI